MNHSYCDRCCTNAVCSGAANPFRDDSHVFDRLQRSRRTTENYAQLAYFILMFEAKSKTDSLTKLRQKIQDFLALGTQVRVLVDPRSPTMEVYRPRQ